MFCPIISSAVKPKIRCALVFQLVIVPSSALLRIASLDVSTTAARYASRSAERPLSAAASTTAADVVVGSLLAMVVPHSLTTAPAFTLPARDGRESRPGRKPSVSRIVVTWT
jgi:hypothetical protein